MKTLRYKISTARDISIGSLQLNAHALVAPPAPPVPSVTAIECPLPMRWAPGVALNQNVLTQRVGLLSRL